MKVSTTRFGDLDVEETAIMSVKEGILGFSGFERYFFLESDKSSPFKWLQSAEDPELAFVVVDPRSIEPDYRIALEPEDAAAISIENVEDCVVYCIVTVGQDPSRITANLAGPILINTKINVAKQLVLTDSDYSTRHRFLG
ncbi:MAG: flagellar assembly protein FliW [Deltaproteobacteria bacterium]|nr:flagellar assembly protein FliW [Deltaproteobacteria bacterium]